MLTAIGLQFDGPRGAIAAKFLRGFRKGIVVFVVALFVIGLLAEYVTPAVIGVWRDAGHGVSAGAEALGRGASEAGGAVARSAAVIVGIVLSLVYWGVVGVWSNKVRGETRMVRQAGAAALYLLLFVAYIKLFVI